MILVIAAHVINIIVAGAVSFLILTKHHSMDAVYQKDTHARRILACVYASIAEMSLVALLWRPYLIPIALVLFPLQIIYKLLSAVFVHDFKNPVIISNLSIATFHTIALLSIVY